MALQSNTAIFIGGKEITAYKFLELHQQIDAHHLLEVVCRMDVLDDLSMALGETSKNFLGEIITIQIGSLDNLGYNELEFKGIVTQIKTIKGYDVGSGNSIVIYAESPTFIADDGPHYTSHNDISLSEIIEKTFSDYDTSKLEVNIQPKKDPTLHYSVQHNESAYEYASRLAAQYGEWFYYNGAQLIFGTPDTKEIALIYGFDLREYHLSLLPQSHNYKYFANDYLLAEVHEKATKEISSGANGYSGFTSDKANTIFKKETKVWHNLYNDPQAKQRLDTSIEAQKKAIEINQVKLNGVSDNPGVRLGSIVNIEGGTYRVTNVTHTNTEVGDYQNRFEAITADFDAYPNTNINAFPKSETQTAIVMENADPDGLGRIRVQMPWQKVVGEMTPWIRIVTPHAGGDKGFHFIPEIDEEVLIGFEGGNAEHPYMLGSLYNGGGKAEAFKSEDNDIKAIKTRSGHTFELNDANGAESITITDMNGNIITIDTANNNITVSALENMTLNAKNMQINVEENFDVTVGKNKTETINENSQITAMNEDKQIGEEIKVISATYVQEAQEITTDASGEIKTNAGGKISISSAETVEYGE
ncbi:MAG: type VI secretion system Vgr family protein [Polaribacter sp.]